MTKKIFIIGLWLLACSPVAFSQAASEKSGALISFADEVSMQVERNGAEVKLRLFITDITKYDHLLIERSADTPDNFGKIRYLSSAEVKPVNGYLLQYDRHPLAYNRNVYYRIKSYTKEGAEKVYTPVLLPPGQ